MKTYIVYVNGIEQPVLIRTGSHNTAEHKAAKLFPGQHVCVVYTEV